jgi:hypothetical protein
MGNSDCIGCLCVSVSFYEKGDQVLQASWGKGADRKPGKGMPKTWAQLESQVLPRNDITVHRALQNSTPLGRFATLLEVALAIIPSANLRIKKKPHHRQPKN